MTKAKYLKKSSLKAMTFVLVFTLSLFNQLYAQGDAVKGKTLFKTNCARCHNVTDQKMIGPGLAGVRDRWPDEANLKAWIINSSDFLKTGDKYANDLYKEYGGQQMPAFTNLSEQDLTDLLAYIDNPVEDKPTADSTANASGGADGSSEGGGFSDTQLTFILIGIAFVLLVLSSALRSVSKAMEKVANEKEGIVQPEEEHVSFLNKIGSWMVTHKKISFVIILVLISWLSMKGFQALNDIGVYGGFKDDEGNVTGYMPDQPIAFSHKLHVGQNKIECTYCHSTAEKSKHASIPSSNVCMNCHKAVEVGPNYGKKEISKIYAAIGWNPVKKEYFQNYQSMDKEEVKKVFAEWLRDSEGAFDEVEKQIQKPVEWVQIHNLPDHAFFSHQQHVVVGKVECATCHGELGEMEKVYQYSPLTMGWCINCHRETEVQYADNGYYERLHNYYKEHYGEYEMKKGQAFTVEKIGGLECSKCHY
jgi:mono/diheme cytochrome c family protein